MNAFEELSQVDCRPYTEKKGKFTYLSWPFAFTELFKRHPKAEIEVREWDGFPAIRGPKGWMVSVSVTVDGVKRTQWHPVLDSNNRAIAEPDVFQLNTSIQRGTVKAIALHGLGLYIYAGEDLPTAGGETADAPAAMAATPMSGVWEAFSEEEQEFLLKQAARIQDEFDANGPEAAAALLYRDLNLSSEEMLGVWSQMPSNVRNQSKKFKAQLTATKEAA